MGRDALVERVVRDRISGYARRAGVLRQIHSNKGARAQRQSHAFLVVTVVVASSVSVIGFMGVGRIAATLEEFAALPKGLAESAYNLSVLAILILTILGLIYRFEERATRHYRSIEVLTEFIRDVEDSVALSEVGGRELSPADLDQVRLRYKGILATLPPNTDKEYVKAKMAARDKRDKVRDGSSDDLLWRDEGAQAGVESAYGDQLAAILSDSSKRGVLAAVRDSLGEDAWVTGGFIRDSVWDRQHGYLLPTPLDDIDVVTHDPVNATKDSERAMEAVLAAHGGNVNWSVKNQARMHGVSSDSAYGSVENAIRHFPETATSVACRLGADDKLHILAPHGLADLFALTVRPTPGFDADRYRARVAEKRWLTKWPHLTVEMPEADQGVDA